MPIHPKKLFFEVSKIIACDILPTVEKHIITLAVNRLACSQPLCAILCNSLLFYSCCGETHVWGSYNVYKIAGRIKVNIENIWKMQRFWKKLWIKWKFELTVFKLAMSDLYCLVNNAISLSPLMHKRAITLPICLNITDINNIWTFLGALQVISFKMSGQTSKSDKNCLQK